MPHYSYLLFDADNTLFDFDAANRNAFHAVCRQCDIPDTDETFALYERCNNAMWAAFDRGECTKDFLVVERFRHFLETMALDRDPALCNRIHLTALGESTLLLSHAEEACRTLSRTHRLYIVTNAVASVQRSRLHRSAVAPYITDAFISEDAGAASPAEPTSTMFSPTSPASHGRTACSSGIPPPAISGAPTTPASPAAGTTPTAPPCRKTSASTTASPTCASSTISSDSHAESPEASLPGFLL